jgi:hypothetical protein
MNVRERTRPARKRDGHRRFRPYIAMETYVVGRWCKGPLKPPEDLEDNIFAKNPFLDDLLEWRHSPEGEQFAELADALCDLMEDVQLDAKQRITGCKRARARRPRFCLRPPSLSQPTRGTEESILLGPLAPEGVLVLWGIRSAAGQGRIGRSRLAEGEHRSAWLTHSTIPPNSMRSLRLGGESTSESRQQTKTQSEGRLTYHPSLMNMLHTAD